MSAFVRAALLVAVLLLCGLDVQAANRWFDNATPQRAWVTPDEACYKGEAERTLNALRVAQPSRPYRIVQVQVSPVDPASEFFCRVVIEEKQSIVWIANVYDSSVFGSEGSDVCHVPGLSDPVTGLCGSRKGNGVCPPGGCNGTNPINHFTGTKYQREVDYVGVGNHPLVFERYYNSRDLANTALSKAWRHSYSASLSIYSDGVDGTVQALRPDGRVFSFALSGGTISRDADVSEQLTVVPQPGGAPPKWTLKDLVDRIETYNGDGRLESIADRAGQTITLTYALNGQLGTVRDHFNRTLTFSYDGNGRISSVTDPDNKVTSYGYDAQGRLSTVTRPDTKVRTYLYNEAAQTGGANLPDAITGLIDETNTRYATWTYDAQGRATSSRLGTGANVQRFSLSYNANGTTTVNDALNTQRVFAPSVSFGVARLQGLSQPCVACGGPNAQSQTFDANGNVATRIDFNNNRTNFTYDLARNLETSRVEALTSAGTATTRTRTITTEWHPTLRLPKRIAEPKRITTYVYNGDSDGGTVTCGATGTVCRTRIQATTDANGSQGFAATTTGTPRVWNYTYNNLGQRLSEDGPRTDVSDITSYAYNAGSGNLTQITGVIASHVIQFTSYDANGRPLTMVDPNSVTTTFTYDYRGLLKTRATSGQTTSFDYNDVGNLQRVTLADGSYADYGYDTAQRLEVIQDNLLNRRVYTRDDAGNITREEIFNPDGTTARLKTRVFDGLSRMSQELGAQSQTTGFTYDGNGNLKTITDPRSTMPNPIVTTYFYDELNRLSQITDAAKPAAGITLFSYDLRDQPTQVIAPNNATTNYTVDGLSNVTQEISPDRGTTNYTQDAAGTVLTRQDARGITATYTYDAVNRPTQIVYSGAGFTTLTDTFTYDQGTNGIGKLTGMTYSGGSTAWTYDDFGRIASRVQTLGTLTFNVQKTYDAAGRVATITYPSGKVEAITYANGQAIAVAVDGVSVASNIAFTPFGAPLSWTWGSGTVHTRSFDLNGRMTGHPLGTDTRTIGYDDAGRITAVTHLPTANLDQSFGYDDLDRLTQATSTTTGRTYGYDLTGNRTQASVSGVTDTYTTAAASNRLTSITGGTARTFTYDAMGNITGDGTFTTTYDARGRMKTLVKAASTTTYDYDASGQRVKKSGGPAGTVHYVYDEDGKLLGEYDATGAVVREYVWLGDVPLAVLTASDTLYVHADHLNAPRAVVNSANQLRWRWTGDPFGMLPPEDNPSGLGVFTLNLRLPGQLYDIESNLHYNYFRDYDPSLGRYVESDPIGLGGGVNTYLYGLANPLSYVDPAGRDPVKIGACVLVAVSVYYIWRYNKLQKCVKECLRCPNNPDGERKDVECVPAPLEEGNTGPTQSCKSYCAIANMGSPRGRGAPGSRDVP